LIIFNKLGEWKFPHNIFIIKNIMKIQKKLIKESIGDFKSSPKTFSKKKQNIVITESQLEKILEKLNSKWILGNIWEGL